MKIHWALVLKMSVKEMIGMVAQTMTMVEKIIGKTKMITKAMKKIFLFFPKTINHKINNQIYLWTQIHKANPHNKTTNNLTHNKPENKLNKKSKKFYIKLKEWRKEAFSSLVHLPWQVIYKIWNQNYKGLKRTWKLMQVLTFKGKLLLPQLVQPNIWMGVLIH